MTVISSPLKAGEKSLTIEKERFLLLTSFVVEMKVMSRSPAAFAGRRRELRSRAIPNSEIGDCFAPRRSRGEAMTQSRLAIGLPQ